MYILKTILPFVGLKDALLKFASFRSFFNAERAKVIDEVFKKDNVVVVFEQYLIYLLLYFLVKGIFPSFSTSFQQIPATANSLRIARAG